MLKNGPKIKVLHLASFSGNIGDNANHEGFYKQFKKIIPADFSQVEIRKFYKNRAELKFDDEFAKLINNHDFLVLGGGGFFDLKWDYSETGTTMDLSTKFIQSIKIPVLVNAMGYHEYDEVKTENVEKFKNFLELITQNKNWLVSVRNDGSFKRMNDRYGNLTDKVLKVPDSGFFFDPKKAFDIDLDDKKTIWIGLNITNDLFNKDFNKDLDIDSFNLLTSKFINEILKENDNYKIMFFPHAHQDVVTVGKIIENMEDKYRREKMGVAPFFTKGKPVEQIFNLYKKCSCVIGMRFHTNVCCIGMNIPTIGLAGHEQISSLYEELGMPDRCVKADNHNFPEELKNKLKISIINTNKIEEQYAKINDLLAKQSESYFKKIKKFIETRAL